MDTLRQQEQQAHEALVRMRHLRDALPADHPSVPLLQTAIARAVVHWYGLQTDRARLEQARQDRRNAKTLPYRLPSRPAYVL